VVREGRGTGAPDMRVPLAPPHTHKTNWREWGLGVLLGAVVLEVAIQIDRTMTGGGKWTSGPVLTVTGEPMSAAFPATSSSYAIYNPVGLTPTKS
jgi:hypothetical protein